MEAGPPAAQEGSWPWVFHSTVAASAWGWEEDAERTIAVGSGLEQGLPRSLITLQVDAGLTGRAWRDSLKRFLTNTLDTDLGLRSSQVLGIHKRPPILFVLPLSFLSFFFFFFFVFLGPHPQHVSWNWSCSRWPMPQPQPCQIRAMSATCTIAHGILNLLSGGKGSNPSPHS